MAECKDKDPTWWEIVLGILGALLLGLLGALFVVIGIIAAVLGASWWLIATMFLLCSLCWLFAILLGLWLKDLLDKLNRHLGTLDRLEAMVEKVEEGIEKLIPKKEEEEKEQEQGP